MLECFTSQRDGATKVTAIRQEAFPGWLAEHLELRGWLSALGFKAEPGTFAFLPGSTGAPGGVIASPQRMSIRRGARTLARPTMWIVG